MAEQERRSPDGMPPRELPGVCPTCAGSRPVLNGAYFRMRRRLANVSLKEIARVLPSPRKPDRGCSVAHISLMERNLRPFTAKHAAIYDRLFERRSAPTAGRSPRHGRE